MPEAPLIGKSEEIHIRGVIETLVNADIASLLRSSHPLLREALILEHIDTAIVLVNDLKEKLTTARQRLVDR